MPATDKPLSFTVKLDRAFPDGTILYATSCLFSLANTGNVSHTIGYVAAMDEEEARAKAEAKAREQDPELSGNSCMSVMVCPLMP